MMDLSADTNQFGFLENDEQKTIQLYHYETKNKNIKTK
jgi:hypothetical protein